MTVQFDSVRSASSYVCSGESRWGWTGRTDPLLSPNVSDGHCRLFIQVFNFCFFCI